MRSIANPTLGPVAPFTGASSGSGQLRPGRFPVASWDGNDGVPISTTTTNQPATTTTTTRPAPPPPPPIIPSDVLFDTDSATLKPEAGPVLKQLADQIAAEYPTASLVFVGHTDSRGTAAHNADLSIHRAQAVLVWFAGYGFDTAHLTAQGDGAAHLLVPDTDAQGIFIDAAGSKNRRVEIQIRT